MHLLNADALHALQHDAERLDALSRQTEDAEHAIQLVEVNYEAGLANSSQVLLADIQYEQAVIGFLEARTARLQDTVALYAALGGGWQAIAGLSKNPAD